MPLSQNTSLSLSLSLSLNGRASLPLMAQSFSCDGHSRVECSTLHSQSRKKWSQQSGYAEVAAGRSDLGAKGGLSGGLQGSPGVRKGGGGGGGWGFFPFGGGCWGAF